MKNTNLLLMTPIRNPKIEWDNSDNIILKIKRYKKIDRFMNKVFKTPLVHTIELDEIGSFVWENCDGNNKIEDISNLLNNNFGQKVEPVLDRLIHYIQILKNNQFISLE